MSESFVAVYDALMRAVVPTVAVAMPKMPTLPRPAYLPEAPPQSVTEYTAALAKLGRLGILRKAD